MRWPGTGGTRRFTKRCWPRTISIFPTEAARLTQATTNPCRAWMAIGPTEHLLGLLRTLSELSPLREFSSDPPRTNPGSYMAGRTPRIRYWHVPHVTQYLRLNSPIASVIIVEDSSCGRLPVEEQEIRLSPEHRRIFPREAQLGSGQRARRERIRHQQRGLF